MGRWLRDVRILKSAYWVHYYKGQLPIVQVYALTVIRTPIYKHILFKISQFCYQTTTNKDIIWMKLRQSGDKLMDKYIRPTLAEFVGTALYVFVVCLFPPRVEASTILPAGVLQGCVYACLILGPGKIRYTSLVITNITEGCRKCIKLSNNVTA